MTYRTDSQYAHENLAPRSQKQWDAFKFTRAVKSRRINGYMTFPWSQRPHEIISSNNVIRARQIFGFFIGLKLEGLGLESVSLIPVPSKDGLVEASTYRSYEMLVDALAGTKWENSIEPSLRFTRQLDRAAAGGTRDREVLKDNMRLTHYPRHKNIVLVDDIITSGGSLLSSYDVLSKWNSPAVCAICCARTVSDSLISAFGDHTQPYDAGPQEF